jgi:Holliday junction resolvase RusA-like endonuclease
MTKENDNVIVFTQNPRLDYLFGYYGEQEIRTKQDKFKPINAVEVQPDGTEHILKNFYVKEPSKESHKAFEQRIKEIASDSFTEDVIKKPNEVEVFLGITMKERRFKEVDVDNLAKSILDCLNGIVYEDDAQVSSLIVNKYVHQMKIDSILIGITKLSKSNHGFIGDISLFKEGSEW